MYEGVAIDSWVLFSLLQYTELDQTSHKFTEESELKMIK